MIVRGFAVVPPESLSYAIILYFSTICCRLVKNDHNLKVPAFNRFSPRIHGCFSSINFCMTYVY